MKPAKNPAAQSLGRLGGLATASGMTDAQRKDRATGAAAKRWAGHVKVARGKRKANPQAATAAHSPDEP